MLIVFTADNNKSDSAFSEHFGRANYFVFYDTITHKIESISNPGKNTIGAAGIQAAQFIISKNVDIVVTGHIGGNAIRFLTLAQIKIISNASGSIKSFIKNHNLSISSENFHLEEIEKP